MDDKLIRCDHLWKFWQDRDKDYDTGRKQLWAGLKAQRIPALAMDASFNHGSRSSSGRPQSHQNWRVDPEVWNFHGDVDFDLDAGIYTASRAGHFSKIALSGLQFDRAALCACLGIPEGLPATAPQNEPNGPIPGGETLPARTKRGRRAKPEWTEFAAAMALWVVQRNDDVATIINCGPDKILDDVLGILALRTTKDYPRSTYQPAVQAFIEMLENPSRR